MTHKQQSGRCWIIICFLHEKKKFRLRRPKLVIAVELTLAEQVLFEKSHLHKLFVYLLC